MNEDDKNLKKPNLPENYGKERIREFQIPNSVESNINKQKLEQKKDVSNLINEAEKTPVFKNILLGKIDENRKYKISNEIAKELIVLEKVVTSKDELGYKAYALCGPLKLNFIVSVKDLVQDESNFKIAYLKLVENYTKPNQDEKSYIVTTIAKFQDIFSDNYLFKVKKAFHLHSKNEIEGKVFEENEILAPITLSLFNRFTLLETNKVKTNLELKHIQDLLKILKETPKGKIIAEKFINQTNFRTGGIKGKEYSYSKLKEILYKIIDSAIQEKKLEAPIIIKISEAKTKHIAEITKEPKKETTVPLKEKPVEKSSPKSSRPISKPKSKTSDNKKKSKDKKKDKGGDKKKDKGKDKKDNKKSKEIIDILEILIERNKNVGKQEKSSETAKSSTQTDNPSQYLQYRGLVSKEPLNLGSVYSETTTNTYPKTKNSNKQQEQELNR